MGMVRVEGKRLIVRGRRAKKRKPATWQRAGREGELL
jgi:hypothetical protein